MELDLTVANAALPVPGGDLPLTFVDGGAPGAAVVVVPSAFGVGPDLAQQMRELAAGAGLVVSFDPFFRDDPGLASYDDMRRVMQRLGGLDRERALADVRAVVAWARAREGSGRVVVVGICLGGPFALHVAADGEADALVAWHGTRIEEHLSRAAAIRGPVRLHYGSADPVVPLAAVDAVRAAFAGHDARVVVHDSATHGFTQRGAPAYDPAAERAAMDAVREVLATVRAPR